MATTSIKTDLRNYIVWVLQNQITWEVQDTDKYKTIVPSAIVVQKTRAQINRKDLQTNQLTDVPGLLICNPFRTAIPPEAGTNERDLWTYLFLVQLVDSDLWSQSDRLATWDRWIEQILSAFMFNGLNGVISLPKGQVMTTTAIEIQDIDERRWIRDSKFIAGVEITVRVLQPRGII